MTDPYREDPPPPTSVEPEMGINWRELILFSVACGLSLATIICVVWFRAKGGV